MSLSHEPQFLVHGRSADGDLLVALHDALTNIGHGLAVRGAGAGDIVALTITARRPAVVHPGRAAVDLAFRESFGGFCPALELHAADHDGVRVEVRLRPPSAPSADPVWKGLTRAALAQAYSPRATVQDMPAIFDAWRRDGREFRNRHLTAEVRYGPLAAETIDLYVPAGPVQSASTPPSVGVPAAFPLWVFIHGGYWQAIDKEHNAHFAAGMLASGFAVALPNYTLAPAASLAQIVQQIQRVVAFLAIEAPALGCDPTEIHLSGHSAGGHLAAMIAALPEGRLIRSCLPLSGVFDLEPLSRLPMGPLLGLHHASTISTLSPHYLRPHDHIRVGVAVGGVESAEFRRQSVDFARAWGDAPCCILPARNHFDLLDGLGAGDLLDFARDVARPRA